LKIGIIKSVVMKKILKVLYTVILKLWNLSFLFFSVITGGYPELTVLVL